ncbi:ATP-grasp domain-containing protein [Enterococcus dispar]|uniref:ATP-grasp domain-containing protein n=1 Tax=Enterococcus dispar TaxID=44009 RepID=UPI00232B6A75|nr:ATP-grasp domain-containing protein [Enterococcus dispar]WCG34069.1 ATP-grasp domain-containing protein [Enterococcus dispar]
MGNKVLVLGASILQVPLIDEAKKMGCYVGICDINPNAVGVSLADEFFEVDIFNEKQVYQVAKKFLPDGICTIGTDFPVRSVAFSCDKLGLPSITYEAAMNSTDKNRMINAFNKSDLAVPWHYTINEISEIDFNRIKNELPCIVKPVDSSGSRGVNLVKDYGDFLEAIEIARGFSKNGQVIIEEFLVGKEVSVEVFCQNKQPIVLQITDKVTSGAPHFVELEHYEPSLFDSDTVARISDLATKAVSSCGITEGPAHVEIIVTSKGPKLVELGARLGGDFITTDLVPLSTGINMVKNVLLHSLGESLELDSSISRNSGVIFPILPIGSVVSKIDLTDFAVKDNIRIKYLKPIGYEVNTKYTSSADRPIAVISSGESREQLATILKNVEKNLINRI